MMQVGVLARREGEGEGEDGKKSALVWNTNLTNWM